MHSVKTNNRLAWRAVLALLLLCGGTTVTAVAAPPHSAAASHLESLAAELQNLDSRMQGVRSQLQERAQLINQWHKQRTNAANPYSDYRLQTLLKEAQGLSTNLQKLETRRHTLLADFEQLNQKLAIEIEVAIERTAQSLANKGLSTAEKSQLSRQLAQLLAARDRRATQHYRSNESAATTRVGQTEATEDLEAKIAFLGDAQERITKQISQVRERVLQLQRQQLVLEEARHLMDEEAFFAETSFAKNEPAPSLNALPSGSGAETSAKLGNVSNNNLQTDSNNGLTANGVEGSATVAGATSAPIDTNANSPAAAGLADGAVEGTTLSNPGLEPRQEDMAAVEPIRRLQPDGLNLRHNADGALSPRQALKQLRLAERELARELEKVSHELAQVRAMLPAVEENQ